MSDAPNPLDPQPMGVDLAKRLAGEIVRGRPAPGTKLVETEICARHGVSRSPLREALGLLERWSLVQRRPRYGVRVAPMNVQHLDDLTTCRLPLEARAAALVAADPRHAGVAATLAAHLAEMESAAAAQDAEAAFTANLAMMDAFHAANPNPVLARLLGELNLPAQRYRYLVYLHAGETLGMLLRSNAAMVAAIRAGNAAAAHDVTERMIHGSWQALRAGLPRYLAALPQAEAAE